MKANKPTGFPIHRMLLAGLLCMSYVSWLHAGEAEAKPWRSTPNLSMGSQDVDVHGRCLRFSATIVDSSLAKLHKKRLPEGTEFRLGKTVVEQFPEELLVEVSVTDCASPYAVPIGTEGLSSLQFGAAWRSGGEDRAATILVPHPREDDSQINDTFRTYEISVTSEDTPLTDQLVLTLSSDGKKLADFLSSL